MWLSHPTPTSTGEQPMTMVNDILKPMPALGQPQRKFLATLFFTILVLRGRVNCRNLRRYCDYAERTIARQFREPFDWPDFPQRVLMTALDPRSALVSAVVYLHPADKYHRLTRRLSQGQKGIDERALM